MASLKEDCAFRNVNRTKGDAMATEFELEEWYPSDTAKRRFGSICQAINERGAEIGLLGSDEKPLLLLRDADAVDASPSEVTISIDEAKANWSAVTAAVLFFDTQFRIIGKKRERAVLMRHPRNRHDALKYRRAKGREMTGVIQKLEQILDELRNTCERLDASAEVISRRFREAWRTSTGFSPLAHH
jgi:hypothetical protein